MCVVIWILDGLDDLTGKKVPSGLEVLIASVEEGLVSAVIKQGGEVRRRKNPTRRVEEGRE